jgi:pimeloyl-ACP methyl ester carboxylesterase
MAARALLAHCIRVRVPLRLGLYHVIAPDYPGFGSSSVPAREAFAYTFAHYAEVVDALLTQLGVDR